MKKSMFAILIIAFISIPFIQANSHFESGQIVTVFATSGLTLRMQPQQSSEALLVIPFGDDVTILNGYDSVDVKTDRINWIDGQWILVDYFGLQGYVFDGFLSTLPMPDHESELCSDCSHLIFPFDQYLDDHFSITNIEPMQVESAVINQFVQELDHNIIRKKKYTDAWFHLEVTMDQVKVGEVLNLFRSMVVNKNLRSDFENSLVFKTDSSGSLNSVSVNMYGSPIRINRLPNGKIKIQSTVIHPTDGC